MDPLGPSAAVLAGLFAAASMDRDRFLADPRRADVPVDDLLAEPHLEELCRAVLKESERPQGIVRRHVIHRSGDTVAIVAADAEGWTVSMLQSLFHSFGSGILEPATGILCHNRGSPFSLDPRSPNVIEGGKRPAHTLMPAMVTRAGAVEAVVGTMGGRAQPQILAQVLLRLLELGMSPAASVEAPRWVLGGLELGEPAATIFAEPQAREAIAAQFAPTGWPVVGLSELDEEVGHAQVIHRTAGSFQVASDPRADGAAAAE